MAAVCGENIIFLFIFYLVVREVNNVNTVLQRITRFLTLAA
jgi:hypothetical protein